MDKETAELMKKITMDVYASEPCRICGGPFTKDDKATMVFAGYSKCSKARSAHKKCWDTRPDNSEKYAYP